MLFRVREKSGREVKGKREGGRAKGEGRREKKVQCGREKSARMKRQQNWEITDMAFMQYTVYYINAMSSFDLRNCKTEVGEEKKQ